MTSELKLPLLNSDIKVTESEVIPGVYQKVHKQESSYSIKGTKHILPQNLSLKPGQDTYTGKFETWPAHSSKNFSQTSILQDKKFQKKVLPKPKFLEGLEAYAKRELYLLNCKGEEPNELRLQAFREVFDYLIEDFKTYKPLLAQIKNEYEKNLSFLRQKISELEPLRSMIVTINDKCELKIKQLKEAEQHEIKKILEDKSQLLKEIQNFKENEISLHVQISRLQEELAKEYKRYRDVNEMRKMLLTDLNELKSRHEKSMQITQVQSEDSVGDTNDDSVTLKIALKVCRDDLTKCLNELNIMKADYNDVVPARNYKQLFDSHEMLSQEAKNFKESYTKLSQEHQTLIELHEEMTKSRDEYYTENVELKRSATPRPDWESCLETLNVNEQRWKENIKNKSSKDILQTLMEEMKKGLGNSGNGVFVGRGLGENIPKHLRFEGEVKNRFMSKAEVSRLVKEIWVDKAVRDGQQGSKQSMEEFIHHFFMKKFRNSSEYTAEFCYSLDDALEKFQEVPNFAFLRNVLNKEANEEFYYRHMQVIKSLIASLQNYDTDNTGTVSPEDFLSAVEQAYPLKSSESCKALLKTCLYELDETPQSSMLKYMDLFTEDEEGYTGPFLDLLRKQENEEIKQYVADVSNQIQGADNEVSMLMLREAFMMADPAINQSQLTTHLSLAFRCSPYMLDDVEAVEKNALLKNLCKSGVHRIGK